MTEQEIRSYYKERKAEIEKQVKAGNIVFLGSEEEVSLGKVKSFLDMFSKAIRENNNELYKELKSMDQEQVIILRLNGLFDCLDLIAGKEEIRNTIESLLEEELEEEIEESETF